MKVLKKRGTMLFLIAALIVTLTLGIIFAMPARTASAEEFTLVTTQEEIENAINASSDENPAYVKLDGDVTMNDGDKLWVQRGQNITIDLNGHVFASAKTTSGLIVNYWGTITITDSSPNKTGLVKSSHVGANAYLFQNHGNLTVDANVDFTNTVGIYNYVRLSDGEYVCKPTVTFKSGNIKVCRGYNAFLMCDASFVFEGGTFSDDADSLLEIDTFSEDGAKISGDNQEAAIAADIAKRKANFDVMAEHRGSDIVVSGGDFSAFDGYYASLLDLTYVYTIQTDIKFYDTYNGSWSDSEAGTRGKADYTVEISGGTWGYDIGAYLAPGYWTVENPDAQGTYLVERAQENRAVVEANGVYFSTFDAAWATAQGRAAMGKDTTLKLLNNCETTTLNFPDAPNVATITIDLNGFDLSITQSSEDQYHVYGYNNQREQITLVVRDGSVEQSGELKLIYLENAENGGIYLSEDSKFVLESGTIRRTGGPLKAVGSYSRESEEYEYKAFRTMFHLAPAGSTQGSNLSSYYEDDMVVIKSGSIISELNGEAGWTEADRKMSFVCFEYGYNGYSSYQSTQYCLKIEPDTDYGKKEDTYYSSFTPAQDDSKTLATEKRKQVVRFDLDALNTYLNGEGKGCRFSWDLSILAPDLVWTPSNGGYIVTQKQPDDNYSVNGEGFAEFAEALQKAQTGDTILVLNPNLTVNDESVILDGVTLDLNTYLRYAITFTNGITLKNGAAIKNGTVMGGGVIVDAHEDGGKSAYFEKAELQCDLTVNANADLVISEGKYAGAVTVQSGANLLITGGSFNGSAIENVDPYFGFALGAYIAAGEKYADGTQYDVKIAPDLDAQKWYENNEGKAAFQVSSPDEWNYFAVYVNSGVDTFQGKKVELTGELNFGGNPSGVSLFAAREAQTPFLPAGNATYRFNGSFDGHNHEISGIVAKEMYVGLFGYMGNGTLSNINLKNSKFTVGNGYLDEFNKSAGYLAGSAITGESSGAYYENLSIEGVTVDYDITGYNIFSGAVLGHTYATTTVDTLKMRDTSVNANWKLGGVVGFYEESFTLRNADIGGMEIGEDSLFAPGVVAGHANGNTTTLEDCKVDAPNDSLIGTSYNNRSKNVTITGAETDIHVESLGADATDEVIVELSKNEETGASSQVQFSADGGKLPSNLTITDSNGENIVEKGEPVGDSGVKVDPENGSLIFEADPQLVDLYTDESGVSIHHGSYATLQEALANAQNGDRIYVNGKVVENVTIEAGKEVIINLLGHTLTGTITVQGTLTLENGVITAESGDAVTVSVSGGKLILAVPALGEGETAIKELTITTTDGNAINGEYTVVTNGNDVCVRKGEQEVKLAAEHDKSGTYTYTADGDTITLHCVHDDAVLGTVTVVAPADLVYSGTALEAQVVAEPVGLVAAPEVVYKNANGDVVESVVNGGVYTANITLGEVTASVEFTVKKAFVRIGGISAVKEYDGSAEFEGEATEATVTLSSGETKTAAELGLTVTVKLVLSDSNVGTHTYAKIVEINVTGDGTVNYDVELSGNQAFIEVEVTARALTVRVNSDGSVSYEGFVYGEDESVLEGELHLERVDNGDGTSTVTPSGLTSANYVITFESGIVENEQSNALWITLAVVGGVIVALGAVAVVYAVRRKKN